MWCPTPFLPIAADPGPAHRIAVVRSTMTADRMPTAVDRSPDLR